jgi:DNA-3-methyladenine glycosylase I
LYAAYHDDEWGRPVGDDRRLFEKMCLEGFQAGLSWLTILKKRPAFRGCFCDFDFFRVARFTDRDVQRLLADPRIVRHRGKIESTINNAARASEMVERHGSLAAFFWKFEPDTTSPVRSRDEVAAKSPQSAAMSRELKRNGWTFVGPTTCYALMQATGMVNDHLRRCHVWEQVEVARREFRRPV